MSSEESKDFSQQEEEKEVKKLEIEITPPPLPPSSNIRRRSLIDLSLGLEAVSPQIIKVKRGSIDLSLGLEYEGVGSQHDQQDDQQNQHSSHNKPALPPSIIKFGLERQATKEIKNENEENVDLSPELLSLLQSTGESEEAWEVKAEHDHKL